MLVGRVVMLVMLAVASFLPARAVLAQQAGEPVVGGVALQRTTVDGVTLFYDPDVDADTVKSASDAIRQGLVEVPEATGLPRFTTPIVAYVMADDARFRLALSEVARVPLDLIAEEIGGYTIERDGRMLVFFSAPNVASPASALFGFAHELAHLAVREATQRRALPQWFNEGYASWISMRVIDRHAPAEAALGRQLDRAAVASALHTRGMLPWADLVTRARFSRAGVDGLVNLAYGQSTLFVDFLVARHGVPALAKFLTTIGEGQTATPAFTAAFGAFGTESAAFEATLATLKTELAPGLYVVQKAAGDSALILAVVGGPARDTAVVELYQDGEVVRRRELDFDGVGLLVAALPASLVSGDHRVSIRVRAPVLGTLELDPTSAVSVHPTSAPQPAPAQLPGRGSVRLLPVRNAA